MSLWKVYLAEAADGSLYTGITTDVERRIKQHNGLHQLRDGQGAKCLRGKRPVRLVWQEPAKGRAAALRREVEIKRLSHEEKVELVEGQEQLVDKE